MTSQLLLSTSSPTSLQVQRSVEEAPLADPFSTNAIGLGSVPEATQVFYQADHQIKFLRLQAEADALLQHLQVLKQQRLSATP
ncbi:MAG: hypothetical protein VKJ46_09610 [Leptolyngbyaceae bacterium]|nr:hypothetical protein [Leptolyngbyaceae bacterium]